MPPVENIKVHIRDDGTTLATKSFLDDLVYLYGMRGVYEFAKQWIEKLPAGYVSYPHIVVVDEHDAVHLKPSGDMNLHDIANVLLRITQEDL